MKRILLRLTEGYGLGDGIQFTVVLKHVRKYRPDWIVDYQCAPDCARAAIGLCNAVFTDAEPATGKYDHVLAIQPLDNYSNFPDRPNTKVTAALHENFGIPYDHELGRYECFVSDTARHKVERAVRNVDIPRYADGRFKAVLLHYQGMSSPHRKNLQDWQADAILKAIAAAGRTPILVDRDGKSPLKALRIKGIDDCEAMAALIWACEAFVGIDSGPGHIASTTDTPTLICWTKNHPVQFHDPAPNTTHMIPVDHRDISPADDDAVAAYFERAYLWRTYYGENGLVAQVTQWLAGLFRCETADTGVTFVVPADPKACAWVIAKIRSVAQGRPIDVIVSEDWRTGRGHHAMTFLRKFDFIRSVKVSDVPVHVGPERPQNTRGHYLYVPDGWRDGYYFLVPSATMQLGKTLAEWMPQVPIDVKALEMLKEAGCDAA
jgi:hypothetical protein